MLTSVETQFPLDCDDPARFAHTLRGFSCLQVSLGDWLQYYSYSMHACDGGKVEGLPYNLIQA